MLHNAVVNHSANGRAALCDTSDLPAALPVPAPESFVVKTGPAAIFPEKMAQSAVNGALRGRQAAKRLPEQQTNAFKLALAKMLSAADAASEIEAKISTSDEMESAPLADSEIVLAKLAPAETESAPLAASEMFVLYVGTDEMLSAPEADSEMEPGRIS